MPRTPASLAVARPTRAALHPSALSDVVAGLARTAHLWQDQLAVDPVHRTGLCLLTTDDYDAWLLAWPARTQVSPHDHGTSIGAFTVVTGRLVEVRWRGAMRRQRVVQGDEIVRIPPGRVHDVLAPGPTPAVSVHAYSPPLTSMGFYDDSGQQLLERQAVGDRIASARVLHPAGAR